MRRVYPCPDCPFSIAPTADTILHDTRTLLTSWFYGMYLVCTIRHGVSGKELRRQMGVTYTTAWHIGQQMRELANRPYLTAMLQGHDDLDPADVGDKASGGKRGRGAPGNTIVMGLVERGGAIKAVLSPT